MLVTLLLGGTGCREAPRSSSPAPHEEMPPEIVVSSARSDLVFGYRDPESGRLVTTSSLAAIPEAARSEVVVTDLSLTPAQRRADRFIYVADVRTARDDGTFPVAIASRYGFQASTPNPSEGAARQAQGVVVYTTSWCGVCKKAKSLLRSWGVTFTERDIEASKSAATELQEKARAAGVSPSGVPVIDVAGTLLTGLDERTLRSVLEQKGLLRP